ncbi:MAG TPA: TolC family protein [Kofleriaceae bacterium]|nr:TolC family protein [Kofleriaceae bacterium]
MRLQIGVLALVLLPSLASADPQKLTLEQVIAKAVANPKVEMALSDRDVADARIHEAYASAVLPRIKATAYGTISPEIHCENPECTVTSPKNFAWNFHGLFGGASVDFTQLLYTFGKASHGLAAARAGVEAFKSLADEAAGDAAVDAARAYWGLKLARELGAMLDDGIEQVEGAKKGFEERKDVTIEDRQRVAVLLATAKVQRAEAAQAEAQALAGLRAITATPDADIDEDELAAVEKPVPEDKDVQSSATKRPQLLAAKSGAIAAGELVNFQNAYYFPDLVLIGSAVISKAQGADDPPSAYANDPYNRMGLSALLALQWQFEPWTVKAKKDRLRAEAHKASAQAALAAIGATYDAATASAEARSAKAKVDAADEGEKAARTWLASVLQNQAVGTAEAKDLADAYIAWFQMKAQWAQAVFQWNVAVVRLGRATGEFHAGPARPR